MKLQGSIYNVEVNNERLFLGVTKNYVSQIVYVLKNWTRNNYLRNVFS